MKTLITRIKRVALALCFVTPLVSWADAIQAVNPVTGEAETYTYKYVGTGGWTAADWQDANGDAPTAVPQASNSNVWDPLLIDGNVEVSSLDSGFEGWNFRVGLFNGADLTVPYIRYWNGGASPRVVVDEDSYLTIESLGDNTWTSSVDYYIAGQYGLWYDCEFSPNVNSGARFNYYLTGEGSVYYNAGITTGVHEIKQADVELSGENTIKNKALVEFEVAPEVTFVATDAKITLKGQKGSVVKYLTSLTVAEDTSLTTDDPVGTCELIQNNSGVYLYWVDGNIWDVETPVYQPSISVNFTQGTALSAGADVGVAPYAVPGTSWNNLIGNNGSLATVTCVDTTGAATEVPGASVTISGTRGYWGNGNVSAANDLRNGYIDDRNNGSDTPTVVVEGIPYYSYKVVAYFSNNDNNVQFGYLTLNGVNYKGDNGATVECTGEAADKWGASSTSTYTEGGNYLVSPTIVNNGGKLTVVSHDLANCRAGLAAIQIVEVKPEAGENELVIDITGTKIRLVEENVSYDKVYVTGVGSLSFTGDGKITTKVLDVGGGITLEMDAAHLGVTESVTGCGTVVYDAVKPSANLGFDDAAWTGTVWVKNIPTTSSERTDWDLAPYGNANSTLRFTGVNLFFKDSTDNVFPGTVDIDGDGMNVCDGYGSTQATFTRLTGSGTLSTTGGSSYGNGLTINDASGFTGTITLTKYKVTVGTSTGKSANGILEIESGKTITVAGATAPGGFVVNGTLVANGTLASSASAAVKGAGTVVFGGVPSPTGDTWWKNSAWTGTVEINGVSDITGTNYAFSDYGNAGSTVKLTNCSGWLKANYTCVPALEIGGTFNWNDGISGLNNVFKVGTLKGSGTISIPANGADKAVWQVTDEWSGFTGAVVGNNTHGRRVLVFGSTLPTEISAGEIYVSPGATLDLNNASGTWWTLGTGFVVDGTLKVAERGKWGGGTAMTLGDTGVLELTSTANKEDYADYSGVTGTGTIKYSSTAGWRLFPSEDAKMPATTLTIQTELADSLIITRDANRETVIGNLAGSKNIRSDWNPSGSASANHPRTLTVTQSKDTEWQGKFVNNRITQFNVVAPAEGDVGTLTLSGTQTAEIPATISGKVNLTGTWVGATTVTGTLGGTGTLTGNLTFSTGSTFKAFSSDEDGLAVSGTVTYPEEGTVTVDVSALEPEADVALLKAADLDATKFALTGASEGATLEVVEGVLTLKLPVPTTVTVTVPDVPNTTVVVTANGVPVEGENGSYVVPEGSEVIAIYTAAAGYEMTGTATYTIDSAEEGSTVTPSITTKQYVAYVVFQEEQGLSFVDVTNYYTTVAAAIDAAKALKRTIVLIAQPDAEDTYEIAVGETINVKKGDFTFEGIIFPTGAQYNNTTTVTAGVTQYKCAVYTATVQYPGQDPEGMTGQLIQILGGLYSSYAPSLAGTIVTVLDDSDATVGDAMPTVFTYDSEAHTYTLKTMVASYNNGYNTVYYPTLAYAVDTVTADGTITLLENVNEAIVNNNDKAFAIDLNGKIWSSDSDVLTTTAGTITINATNGGTMTTEAEQCCAVWSKGGNVVINGGTFVSKDYEEATVYVSTATGTVTINGGTFQNTDTRPYRWKTSWNALTLNVHNTNCTLSQIVVYGGTFYGNNPANGDDNLGGTFLAEGYQSTETSTGVWTVTEKQGIDPADPTSTQEVTPSAEEIADAGSAEAAAKAKATVTVPEAVATATGVTEETYKSYFTLSATETSPGSGVYEVAVVGLNEAVVFPTSEAAQETADLADVLDADAGDGIEITTAKPGLYYSIEAANSVDFATGKVEGARELATTTTVSPAKPAKTGTAVFYRVKVSVTAE